MLNFYRGLQVKPLDGDVSPYLDHLKHVICAGHEPSYRYLIGWMAHLFQKPDEKPTVAIMLKSVEGTGKGTMAEPLLRILGPHGIKTNGAGAIANRFNGTVANKLGIFADEVDLTDKHMFDRMKGIVSETTVNMERKGLEIEPLPNYCRLIFASNHEKVLSAGIRERRYLVLEPSDRYAQDQTYFKRLWSWINNDGPAKFLNYLLNVDISDFEPYRCPQTPGLISEKLDNLSGVNQFFYNQIIHHEPFGGRARIRASELIDDFIAWSAEEGLDVKKASAANSIGRTMAKLGIEVHGRSDRGNGKFYELPDKAVLVQQFAKMLDVPEEALEP
ncbi:primase-helicase family protein [Methylomonas sp. MgM2]